jgi:hypothetical protein
MVKRRNNLSVVVKNIWFIKFISLSIFIICLLVIKLVHYQVERNMK